MVEKNKAKNIKRTVYRSFMSVVLAIVLSVSVLTVAPRSAVACETAMQVTGAGALMQTLQEAALMALQNALTSFVASLMAPFEAILDALIGSTDDAIRQDLSELWDKWKGGLEDMTEQLNVSYIDRTRQQGSMLDAQMQSMAQRYTETLELEANRRMRPSEQMCVVDTINPYLLKAEETARAMGVAMENEFFAGGIGSGAMNMVGTASENGPEAALNADYDIIINDYLDPNYNGGDMPAGAPSPRAGDEYNPAKVLFGKDTIDMTDPDNRQDLAVYTRLALGNPAMKAIPLRATETTHGQRTILDRQRYQARLNNYAGALMDPASNRSSVTAAPEVGVMRMSNGTLAGNISAAPSYREIRKARSQQMWTPRYMNDLTGMPHTAEQKQVDIYAQKIMDVQDMTRNMERIGMIMSARLGQRLDTLGPIDSGASADIKAQ